MSFLTALNRLLRSDPGDPNLSRSQRDSLLEAWGPDTDASPEFPAGSAPAADPAEMAAPPRASDYDRTQWRLKLKTTLDRLPGSESHWDALLADIGALGLDPEWARRCQIEEFALLVRRAIVDRVVTPQEHRNLELARTLIGLSEPEAVQILEAAKADVDAFFSQATASEPA